MSDEGYFPRGSSVLRRVQGERRVGLLYGQRALCIGALKPLNYVGTDRHTRHPETPFRRLAVTGRMFESVFFGTRPEADRVLAAVAQMHTRVRGVLPEDAGPYAKGTPYSATDPVLMLWTIAVMMDSAECFYDLLVRELTDPERDALWSDYVRFGELFGMPHDAAPPTYREFRAWYDGELAGEDLFLTDRAKMTGHAVAFQIPLPAHAQLGKRVHDLLILGALPPRVRSLYGLRYTPAHAAAFTAAATAARASRPLTPRQLARGRNTRSFNLVADTERARIERGAQTFQLAA